MDTHFSEDALRLGPWSPSKVSTGDQCPWKFNRQYVERLRVPPEQAPDLDDSALRVGKAVHRYAELLSTGTDSARGEATSLRENRLVSNEKDRFLGMREGAEEFVGRINKFKDKHHVTDDLVEHKLALTPDLQPADFWDNGVILRGVVDRCLIVDGLFGMMFDIKTGAYPTLRYSELQLAAYALLAFSKWPSLRYVHSALYFVPSKTLLWSEKVYRKGYPLNEENTVISHINATAGEVLSDEIRPGKYCSWCVYKPACLEERKSRRRKNRGTKERQKAG